MLDFQDLYITLAGILIGYISSITGGLGLMAVPLLVHFGLTPQIAVTTSKFGALGMVIGSLLRFSKTNNINHELVPKLVLIQFLGTLLGAYIFVQLPQGPWMKTAVAGLTLMLLPVTFLRNPKQDSETATQDKSQIGYFLYFLISIYMGIYGAGAGPLVFMTFVHCFGLSLIAANATGLIPFLASILTSIGLYFYAQFHGAEILNYQASLFFACGTFIGGNFGARDALKRGEKYVQILFLIVTVLSALSLLI